MQCYSHCLEVLQGPPFWEEVEGDTILPPPMVRTLRGRPKKQRRRGRWEPKKATTTTSGKEQVSRIGRVMHCTNCKKSGHNIRKCPDPITVTIGRKRKTRNPVNEEAAQERETAQAQNQTGEDELMGEAVMQEMASQTRSTIESQP